MDKLSLIHIKSFDFMLRNGIKRMVEYLVPSEFTCPNGDIIELRAQFIEISSPSNRVDNNKAIYPHECRRQGKTYNAELRLSVRLSINGVASNVIVIPCGDVPIMVLSHACNLSKIDRKNFAKYREEEQEIGGYFLVNGKERVVRMIIMSRRNFPLAIARASFKKRGHGYTEQAIVMRCVREDESVSLLMLHWLMNGEPVLAFVVEREQFFVPISIILRAMVNKTEYEMFDDIRRGNGESFSLEETAMRILVRLADEDYSSQTRALRYLGRVFRGRLHVSSQASDEEAGVFLIRQFIAIHLDSVVDKYHLMCFMVRKLHAFVSGQCCEESNDNLMFQEVLLPSTLYLQVLREKVIQLLNTTKDHVLARARKGQVKINSVLIQQSLLARGPDVATGLHYLLATGNLPPSVRSALSAQLGGQSSGLSVPADSVNFLRMAAQFRAVHRGAMFMDIRTTGVRRLLPEAWGFICPVHTPDGAPCGLLNHLAEPVKTVCETPRHASVNALATWLSTHKVRPIELSRQLSGPDVEQNVLPVLLDGRLVGWCSTIAEAQQLADELRERKLGSLPDGSTGLFPRTLEIALVPPTEVGSQYPGLFLFTGSSRLVRPVLNLKGNENNKIPHGSEKMDGRIEWIGTFEQPYMDIAVTKAELSERSLEDRSHMEITPDGIFSFVAGLTPYQDFNQSPRNMYQCQMAKQSMGHSCYSWRNRSDAKAYRMLTPQSPLVRTKMYKKYAMDHYPLGFNAIVAVMSYTGYDMEDAMVINKGSYDRGFAGACIYKSEVIDLSLLNKQSASRTQGHSRRKAATADHYFGAPGTPPEGLDCDGFPPVGTRLRPKGSPLYCYTHVETQHTTIVKYEGGEQIAFVDAISLNGSWSEATITLRLPRPPDIGDKYSSRHGQKGINSLLVPSEEMPWTVSGGVVPDLIFNPHGFPTRMTMGMVMEFLAGKSAALTGNRIDATPFQWDEDHPPFVEYCQQLANCGLNYWGTEMMMSGCTGREVESHIFMGVVYYQRLRHMVADKYQVRSEGRFDSIMRQPIKGRKLGGGIRLGEMERDCLLSQGLSFALQDRMVESNCDTVTMLTCTKCSSLLHADLAINVESREHGSSLVPGDRSSNLVVSAGGATSSFELNRWVCRLCDRAKPDQEPTDATSKDASSREEGGTKPSLTPVRVSAAFRYLTYELACMNIRTRLVVSQLA